MPKTRVIIVDDSASIRELFTAILSADPSIEVVGTAEDPYDAREKIKQLNPDLITLDVEMPKMDGISFLEKIMTLRPMPVIMASTLTSRGADTTIRALETGAVDYITKPKTLEGKAFDLFKEELVYKVKQAAFIKRMAPGNRHMLQQSGSLIVPFKGINTSQLIAIGASTGGVEAIREILIRMPANSPPIVITQHMPEVFTASFAARMDGLCAMKVHEAFHNQPIQAGNVYIAAGNYHLEIKQKAEKMYCHLSSEPLVSGHRPSVDVLFESVAQIHHKKVIGVILTGMGQDGAKGLLKMRKAGAATIGESEASCTVYGMPKAAFSLGAVEKQLPLLEIPKEILALCKAQEGSYALSKP